MQAVHVATPDCRTSSLRAHKLVEYTDSTSWIRVFAVCSMSFLPAFVATIIVELIPLRVPSDGWKANWVFWLRLFFSNLMISGGAAAQMAHLIPAAGLTRNHIFLMAIVGTVVFEVQFLVLATLWRFPVPFSSNFVCPGWYLSMVLCAVSVVGLKKWRNNAVTMEQMAVAIRMALAQSSLILIYPLFSAAFLRLHGTAQVVSMLALPVIKFVMNTVISRLSVGTPAAGAIGIATVELFDALYLFKCMQSAGSMRSGICLIIVDLLQNIYHLWKLHKHAPKVRQNMDTNGRGPMTVDSKLNASLDQFSTKFYLRAERTVNGSLSFIARNNVAPFPRSNNLDKSQSELIDLDSQLQDLLLHCEHIVFIEFIECSVPMFYALYMTILFHLPNAKFYPEMEHIDATKLFQTARNIAAYAILEFGSLFYVHAFLRWKFHISAFHLLASLLEREREVFQGLFMTWVIIVLQFTLQHTGT